MLQGLGGKKRIARRGMGGLNNFYIQGYSLHIIDSKIIMAMGEDHQFNHSVFVCKNNRCRVLTFNLRDGG